MSSGLSDAERINLKKMINESECGDNTDNIRKLKHSVLMRDDIRKIDTLKNTHPDMKVNENDKFVDICRSEAPFLFSNYTDIFNKLVSDELDMTIMTQFLTILRMIEDSKIDQHEGSVMVGKLLKQIYVDSATKRMDKLDANNNANTVVPSVGKSISWKEYKQMK